MRRLKVKLISVVIGQTLRKKESKKQWVSPKTVVVGFVFDSRWMPVRVKTRDREQTR